MLASLLINKVYSKTSNLLKPNLALYFCRLLTGCYVQDFNKSVLLMNKHSNKGVPQETLLQPDDSWIATESNVKPYILKILDNIKLSRSQCFATSIINYDPYIYNMFACKKFVHTFCRQLAKVITSETHVILN